MVEFTGLCCIEIPIQKKSVHSVNGIWYTSTGSTEQSNMQNPEFSESERALYDLIQSSESEFVDDQKKRNPLLEWTYRLPCVLCAKLRIRVDGDHLHIPHRGIFPRVSGPQLVGTDLKQLNKKRKDNQKWVRTLFSGGSQKNKPCSRHSNPISIFEPQSQKLRTNRANEARK